MTKLAIIFIVFIIATAKSQGAENPLQHLINDLTDEILHHAKFSILCDLDPLTHPGIKEDHGFVETIVSDIQVNGILNIVRSEDVRVHELADTRAENKSEHRNYNISSTLRVPGLKLQFRFQAVNIISSKWVDFIASGTADLKINFQIYLSPSQRKLELLSVAVENLENINWNLDGRLLNSEWLMSKAETKITAQINKIIVSTLTTAITEAITNLNKKVETLLYFFPKVDHCPAPGKASCPYLPPIPTSIESDLLSFGPILMEKGPALDPSGYSEVLLTFKNKTIGNIPPSMIYTPGSNLVTINGMVGDLSIPQEFHFLRIIQSDTIAGGKQVLTFANSLGNLFFDGYKLYDTFYSSKPSSYKYFDFPGIKYQDYAGDGWRASFFISIGAIHRGENKVLELPNVLAYHDGGRFTFRGRTDGSLKEYVSENGNSWELKFAKGENGSLALFLPSDTSREFNLIRFINKNMLI